MFKHSLTECATALWGGRAPGHRFNDTTAFKAVLDGLYRNLRHL